MSGARLSALVSLHTGEAGQMCNIGIVLLQICREPNILDSKDPDNHRLLIGNTVSVALL